jgi:predicted 3-demethylubiquinone-9 3-methyltransferase (glyoxalase superfamily)
MQKITPFLWFDDNAEEAIHFYLSIFKNGEILSMNRNREDGKLFVAKFKIEDQEFIALNGGPEKTVPQRYHNPRTGFDRRPSRVSRAAPAL